MTQEGYQVIIILPIKSKLAAAKKRCFNPNRAGGGAESAPPSTFFCYISAGCYFFALKLHDFFFFKPCAQFKTIFKKNRTGGYDAALRNRALGPTKN